MSLFDNSGLNSTLYEYLCLQLEDTWTFAKEFFESCVSTLAIEKISNPLVGVDFSLYEDVAEVFYFNEFQFLLLKTFLLILLITLILIFLLWRVYGKRISESFMKPATSATIEQLRESVSKLKLPKEHTPRI